MFKAQILHASIIKKGLHTDVYHCNLLLQAYTKTHAFSSAQKLLHFMPNANVVSHNTLLSGFFNAGLVPQALQAFSSAPTKDSHSWNILISGCVKNRRTQDAISHFMEMRQNSDLKPDDYAYSVLLSMYAGCGVIEGARKVFDEMPRRDFVTWNALISGYSRCGGLGDLTLSLFKQMYKEGVMCDEFTYAIILNEMASHLQLVEAMQIQSMDCSLALFEEIKCKDFFASKTIVTGLSQSGHMDDALWLFYEMQWAGVEPNSFTFGGLIAACETRNTVQRGKQLHGCAFKMFQSIPERDIVVWNGIVCGYAHNGEPAEALKLYNAMMRSWPSAISPNHATFVGVLVVTVGCEAEALLLQMPFGADSVMWSTLLRACKLHRNLTMAKRIYEHLHIKGPWNSSNYVLANSYALMGEWNESLEIREMVILRGLKKSMDAVGLKLEKA
ncbi:pentatricopeptide repeat-containing protein [Senna tora]|uniref:Pentatricopeptide repeat-containing protein n=1 Tax=Senna tora TaxID=362788 RepID=A0A834WVG3_9FABA|nr:pentatricopeptide repeat-containing protein [Senna tora]